MARYFNNYTSLFVANDTVSDETDINTFATNVFNAFGDVESDVVSLESNQNKANLWSREVVGTLVTDQIGGVTVQDYSSQAYRLESKEWAQSEDGLISLADGTTTAANSAKEWATDASTSASSASTSASNAATSENNAAASAASALGANSISAGSGIVVNATGIGPFDYEIVNNGITSVVESDQTVAVTSLGSGIVGLAVDDNVIFAGSSSWTYLNVTGSRTLGLNQTGTNDSAIYVRCELWAGFSGSDIEVFIDDSSIGIDAFGSNERRCITFVVPAGADYRINASIALNSFTWYEMEGPGFPLP